MSRPGAYRGRSLFELFSGRLYADLERDYRRAVFLAGSGRSGTTWVSELINYRNEYRYVFEPFHPGKVGVCRHFRPRQYLRPDDLREEFLAPARLILSGGLRDGWSDRFNRKLLTRRRLIKDIRANLLLGWMRANFPGMPIVLVLRHPCAVALSRTELGWRDVLDDTMQQRELVRDFLQPMEQEIREATGAFERHVFLWCVENYVPLRQFAPGEIHVCFYERLLAEPEEELYGLFRWLGREPGAAREVSPERRRSVEGWTRRVSGARRRRAVEILKLFGLDGVYGEEPMPEPAGVRTLMKSPGVVGGL